VDKRWHDWGLQVRPMPFQSSQQPAGTLLKCDVAATHQHALQADDSMFCMDLIRGRHEIKPREMHTGKEVQAWCIG